MHWENTATELNLLLLRLKRRTIKKNYVARSRYINKYQALAEIGELYRYLSERTSYDSKEIFISCADAVTEELNKHIDSLSVRYVVPGIPKQGGMSE